MNDRGRLGLALCVAAAAWALAGHPAVAQNRTGQLNVSVSSRTGHATFVTGLNHAAIPVQAPTAGAPLRPVDFFRRHGALFGISNAERQLRFAGGRIDAIGQTHTTYHQMHNGVRVFAGVLKVHQDPNGAFTAANGDFFPVPQKLSVTPSVTVDRAEKVARAQLGRDKAFVEHSELVVVDPGWYGDPAIGPHLAYHVNLHDRAAVIREAFLIDAHTTAVLDRWSMIHDARDREIHDAAGGSSLPGPVARTEGQPPTGVADVDQAYDYAGDAYDYFFRAFGRDGLDDQGMPLVVTVRSTALPCPNASWDGEQLVLCSGMVTDDIVAHELTHGITEYTANLIYQNQPGQLNESFSDIFGELIDLFNGDAAFPGTPGNPPNWPTHPSGPGTDVPNNLRAACSIGYGGFADGYRWLIGEDTSLTAFRDMWDPTCMGDPDRANSPFETCDPSDRGGVHSGSGVANHAFAIMTDGKTFNGQTVTGIGPIKAGAVWYRALTTYLTVASDFEDAYQALNQAAADLIGTDPSDPRTGLPSGDPFTASDAEQVDKALLAVEMNTAGACGATVPVLDSAPPVQCGPPRTTIFADDFENGLNGWTVSNTNPPTPYDWAQTVDVLPFGRPGTAWFVADPEIGDCDSQDESSVHYLTSPTINMPAGPIRPALAFTHYVATELSFDGGNVQISLNGGDSWQLIPAADFEYNPYNTTLRSALAGSTNPLAGQAAWSGAGGQWGTSVIDLSGLLSGGETVQIRFRFGKDGCRGVEGWYIDDFEIYTCPPGPPTAVNTSVGTAKDTPLTVTLVARDEGLPDPPGMLTFTVISLPGHGTLSELGVGPIGSVPYTLVPGANQVTYKPGSAYAGGDSFTFKSDDGGSPPEGGESNEATVSITVGGPDHFTELFTGASDPFDLDYRALLFTPDGSSDFYEASLRPITELPTDPAGGGQPASPLEDGSDLFFVAGGQAVSIYGHSYSSFWFSSNGFITFDTYDGEDLGMSEESLAGHFSNKRISALFDDLSPPAGGTWSWKQLTDRIAITWENIPERGTSNSNTFQVELYFDGRIQIAWLNVDAQDGLVGLSNGGGLPPGFAQRDLSSYPADPGQPGDHDDDGDVDQDDYISFGLCSSGPGVPQNDAACAWARLDGDEDVDQMDFSVFQRCFSGENVPAVPSCAQ